MVDEVNKALAAGGLSIAAVVARNFSFNVDKFERIDAMTAIAEARRNAAVREINRHREVSGPKFRGPSRQLESRQPQVVESASSNGTNAK